MNPSIQLPVAELKSVLPGFSKIIGRSSIPILSCVRVIARDGNPVVLQTANVDDFASYRTQDVAYGANLDLFVPYSDFIRVVKSCPPRDTIQLHQRNGEIVLSYPVGASRVDCKIPGFDPKLWPISPTLDNSSIVVGEEFKAALKLALDCSSEDGSRPILNSAYIDVSDPAAHYVVGTDGRQMFAANSFSFDLKESVLLPRRPFLLWKGFFEDGNWQLSLQASQKENESGWVQIQSKNWTLITRQLCGSYPNWRGPIPSPDQKKCAFSFTPEAIETVLATIPKLPGREETNQPVTLRFDGCDGFALETRSIGQDSPLSVPVTGVSIQGQPDAVQLNRTFLMKAFKLGLSELELFGPSLPLIFRAGGRRLVVQPLSPPPDEPIPQTNQPPASQATSSSPEMPDQIQEETPKMKNTNRSEQIDNTAETNSGNAAKEPTVFMQAMDQVEKIKEALKSVVTDLQTLSKLLTHAQREKKTTEKEIESIRDTLQSLQRIRI